MIREARKSGKRTTPAWISKSALWLASAFAVLAQGTLAFAQNCAMCYNTASAAKPGAIHALRTGILVLLVPPVLMFICIFARVFRSKERSDGEVEAGG